MNRNILGIIGCSNVFEKRFYPSVVNSKNTSIKILGSRNLKKAKILSSKLKINEYGRYIDVFKDREVRTVYISTPVNQRHYLFDLALQYKKNVFCEKPSFTNYKDAQVYYKKFQSKNLMFFDCWMFFFHSQHSFFKKIWSREFKNQKFNFKSEFHYPYPDKSNIRLKHKLKGGVFFDSFGYTLNALLLYMKNPISLKSKIKIDSKLNVDTNFQSKFQFKNGSSAIIHVKFSDKYRSNYKVYNAKKILKCNRAFSVDIDHIPKITLIKKTIKKNEIFKIKKDDQFKKMINSYSNLILEKNKKKYLYNIKKSLYFYLLYEKCYDSAIYNQKLLV